MVSSTTTTHTVALPVLTTGSRVPLFTVGAEIAKTIYAMVTTYFLLLKRMGQAGLGVREFTASDRLPVIDLDALKGRDNSDWSAVLSEAAALQGGVKATTLNRVHGACVTAGGVCGVVNALDETRVVQVGARQLYIAGASRGLFCLGNVVSLYDSIIKLQAAIIIMFDGGAAAMPAHLAAYAAAMGVLSSLGFVLVELLLTFDLWSAAAVVIGGLATVIGCIRWVYEYTVVRIAWQSLDQIE
jgi:hypothetical protein